MDRRIFLSQAAASALVVDTARRFTLENQSLAWHLETYAGGVRSTAFENKLSGRRVRLLVDHELALTFSAARERLEIPWWDFRTAVESGGARCRISAGPAEASLQG